MGDVAPYILLGLVGSVSYRSCAVSMLFHNEKEHSTRTTFSNRKILPATMSFKTIIWQDKLLSRLMPTLHGSCNISRIAKRWRYGRISRGRKAERLLQSGLWLGCRDFVFLRVQWVFQLLHIHACMHTYTTTSYVRSVWAVQVVRSRLHFRQCNWPPVSTV